MTVRYRWHPWFEQSVQAVKAIHRRSETSIRVEYPVGNRVRWMDLPMWMFDSGVCASMILADVPVVSSEALVELKFLIDHCDSNAYSLAVELEHLSSQSVGDAHDKTRKTTSRRDSAESISAQSDSPDLEKSSARDKRQCD
jgi:hypothetical protein